MGNNHSLVTTQDTRKLLGKTLNIPQTSLVSDKISVFQSHCSANKFWKVKTIEIRDVTTGDLLTTDIELKILDPNLRDSLTSHGVTLYSPPLPVVLTKDPKLKPKKKYFVGLEQLLLRFSLLKNARSGEGLTQLCKYLQIEEKTNKKKCQELVKKGMLTFDCCWRYFVKGQKVTVELPFLYGDLIGTEIQSLTYSRSIHGPSWRMTGKVMKTDGHEFFMSNITFELPYFSRPTPVESLSVRGLTPEAEALLVDRGRRFREMALGHHLMEYQGFFYSSRSFEVDEKPEKKVVGPNQKNPKANKGKVSFFGPSKIKAEGRVMIDVSSYNRFHSSDPTFTQKKKKNGSEVTDFNVLPDQFLYCTWPTLPGFSFQRKRWGKFILNSLSTIRFDEEAFERLVLKQETKELIQCMVRSQGVASTNFEDMVQTRRGGRIFLLHGPPGTGKTLTAEAISESLHTPLYSISMGELGVTPSQLESQLQRVLELAAIWRASILLDEADIFLEQRKNGDIVRNAMVGIFLKLLEYHQGVLFLTTNRLKSFDPATQSRISLPIKFKRLNFQSRKKIWINLLEASGNQVKRFDVNQLAQFPLNGRQIRNTLRMATVMAHEEQGSNPLIGMRQVLEILELTKNWSKEFEDRQLKWPDDDENELVERVAQNPDMYNSEEE